MKLRTFVLAAAGTLGSVAVAQAQTAPPPPPPPAAPPEAAAPGAAPAPPTQPGAAPAAQPAPAPAPPPPALPPAPPTMAQEPIQPPPPAWQPSFTPGPGSYPQPDTVTEEPTDEKEATKLPWRGTTFTWNHAWTTSLIGIGADYNSREDQFYGWSFLLKPNFYLVDQPKDKLSVSADIAWETELTDGGTTQKRETLFQDLGLGAKYARTVFESGGSDKGEYKTSASLGGKLRFPTSKFSAAQGKYLTTQLGVSVSQQIKILGSKAAGLNSLTAGLGLTWSHLFSRSFSPTNPDLTVKRQNATGQTEIPDVLTTRSFAINTLTPTLTIALPLYHELELGAAFGILAGFAHEFSGKTPDGGCPVTVATGECPPNLGPSADAPTTRLASSFDLSLSYPILEVAAISAGYQNNWQYSNTDELTNRNFFYGYDAQFYVDITANLDGIYSKATGRDKRPTRKQTASR